MSSEPYFPVSIPALKRELLSNTHSLQIIHEGVELSISPTLEIGSSNQLTTQSSPPLKQRLLFQILLGGSTFDVSLPIPPREELAYSTNPIYRWHFQRLRTFSRNSTLILLQGRKLDVTPAIEGASDSQVVSHALERQFLFQIQLEDNKLDVTGPPPPLEQDLAPYYRLKRLIETNYEIRHEDSLSFDRNGILALPKTRRYSLPAVAATKQQKQHERPFFCRDLTNTVPNRGPEGIYEPLEYEDSIRLLFLEACSMADDPIKCTIAHSRLSDRPQYYALSYEWGPEDDKHDPVILINRNQHLRIRKNLYYALMEIRASDKWSSNQALWVDAICINQQNCHGEKPHQVRMMGNIYRQAALVIAWLGVARDDSDIAMDVLNTYSHHRCRAHQFFEHSCIWCEELCSVAGSMIDMLWKRSYWRRVWIMQELQLSRSLVLRCGSKSIAAEHLEWAFALLEGFLKLGSNQRLWCGGKGLHLYVPYMHLVSRNAEHKRLGELIQICVDGDFEALEPRDYLYALLAICTDRRDGTIEVDYAKPVDLLYREALAIMRTDIPSDQWLSFTGGGHLARRLAEKMGTKFEFFRDIIRTDLIAKESLVPSRPPALPAGRGPEALSSTLASFSRRSFVALSSF